MQNACKDCIHKKENNYCDSYKRIIEFAARCIRKDKVKGDVING